MWCYACLCNDCATLALTGDLRAANKQHHCIVLTCGIWPQSGCHHVLGQTFYHMSSAEHCSNRQTHLPWWHSCTCIFTQLSLFDTANRTGLPAARHSQNTLPLVVDDRCCLDHIMPHQLSWGVADSGHQKQHKQRLQHHNKQYRLMQAAAQLSGYARTATNTYSILQMCSMPAEGTCLFLCWRIFELQCNRTELLCVCSVQVHTPE